MDKLQYFIDKRKNNWMKINNFLEKYEDYLLDKTTENSDPSWFGYAITVKENKYFNRDQLVNFLNENRIATRLMFGGNLVKRPAYKEQAFRIHNNLINADIVMNSTFWIGVYPGINDEMLEYIFERFEEFIESKSI